MRATTKVMTGVMLRKAHAKVADVSRIPTKKRYCVRVALAKEKEDLISNHYDHVVSCIPST